MDYIVTLNTLLRTPNLTDLVVVAGKAGLGKEINAVATLDAPDGPNWLKGRELILTSAYIFGEDANRIEAFVQDLIHAGAAGLAFKTGRFLKQVPPRVVALGDQNNFPIIMIPQKLVWSDIIAPFYELTYKINSCDNLIKIEPETIDQIFMAGKWGSRQMVAKLTELFQVPIVLVKRNKKLVADNGLTGVECIKTALKDPSLFVETSVNGVIQSSSGYLIICPLPFTKNQSKEYLALLSSNENFAREMLQLFKLFSSMLGADGSADRGRAELYRKFLLGIVSGGITEAEMREFSVNHGYDGAKYHCILLISGEEWNGIYHKLCTTSKELQKGQSAPADSYLFYDENNQEAVVLLELPEQNDRNFNVTLRSMMDSIKAFVTAQRGCCIAVGNVCATMELKTSYRQACEAKRIGRLLWEGQNLYFFSCLSVYSALAGADPAELDLSDVLYLECNQKPLSFDGIATLEAYIECGNYRKAAAKLYIHENTLRYRIQKLGELLYLDVEDPLAAQCILFKIKLWRLFHGNDAIL